MQQSRRESHKVSLTYVHHPTRLGNLEVLGSIPWSVELEVISSQNLSYLNYKSGLSPFIGEVGVDHTNCG